MPIPQTSLRARLVAGRRAPLLPVRVATRRMSAPTIPPRTERGRPVEERPDYDRREYNKTLIVGQGEARSPAGTGVDWRERRGWRHKAWIAAPQIKKGNVSKREAWKSIKEGLSVAENERTKPEERAEMVRALRAMVADLLSCKRWGPGSTRDGPSIPEVLRVYVGALKSRDRTPVVRLLAGTLSHLVAGRPTEEEASEALGDVVAAWVALFRMSNYVRGDSIRMPSLRSRKMQQLARGPEPFAAMIHVAATPLPLRDPHISLAPLLLTTYVLVEERSLRGTEAAAPIEPLLGFMEGVMGEVFTERRAALDEFKSRGGCEQLLAELREYVAARLGLLGPAAAGQEMDAEQLHRRLSRGLTMRSADHVRQAWATLSRQIEALAPRLAAEPELRARYAGLLDFCVCIWCALGRDDEVDVVLRLMGAHGFGRTVRTYTSMIEGWKLARQPRHVAALWERLGRDGVPLDAVIWSARISALMTCGLQKPALRALDEMGQLWDAAVKRAGARGEAAAEAEAVRPEVGPVNAALAGVLRSKGVEAAPPILSWAARYGVDPDIATYNMLLRAMLHEGRSAEADALLREMNAGGVAADAATFTIIVEEVLGAAAGAGEDARLEAVRGIFAAIEASGQSPKAATYAKMVHVLLKEGRGGEGGAGADTAAVEGRAVREVLAHMQRRGAGPTSHVFTIIADHQLAAGDAAAVRAMIAAWGLSSSDDRVDGVFWEVVIRGFASAGLAREARDMFFALRRESRVALGVLDQLLVGLLEEGDVEGARALVREVKVRMREGGVQGEVADGGERFLRHRFWHVVAENGLDDV